MRILLLVFLQVFALHALAQEPLALGSKSKASYFAALVVNPEMRLEYDTNKDLVDRKPFNLMFVYGLNLRTSLALEYAHFSESSGNASSHLSRTHTDMLFWMRYHFVPNYEIAKRNTISLYAGAGAGAYQEKVETTLSGVSREDQGAAKLITGLSLGGQYRFYVVDDFAMVAGLEARGLFASDFNPNPVGSVVLHLGALFAF